MFIFFWQREAMAKAMIRVRNDFFFILMILNGVR